MMSTKSIWKAGIETQTTFRPEEQGENLVGFGPAETGTLPKSHYGPIPQSVYLVSN